MASPGYAKHRGRGAGGRARLPGWRVIGDSGHERQPEPGERGKDHGRHKPGDRVVDRFLAGSFVVPAEICGPDCEYAAPGDGGGALLQRRPHAGRWNADYRQPADHASGYAGHRIFDPGGNDGGDLSGVLPVASKLDTPVHRFDYFDGGDCFRAAQRAVPAGYVALPSIASGNGCDARHG